jgi:WS/DGAT/MGAT family acyltransferase
MSQTSGPIERVSANDATTLATDRGPAPMNIGAVLVIEGGGALDLGSVRATLEDRLPRVRRLRQRVVSTPIGCGRPVWVDVADFDLTRHLDEAAILSPSAASNSSPLTDVLDVAAPFVCTPLPLDRPLWAARWLTGLPDGAGALILVVHHCLADGLGGLAVLAALSDGGETRPDAGFPRQPPSRRDLFVDAMGQRALALSRSRRRLRRSAAGLRELFGTHRRPRFVARTSLNRATGPLRRLTSVTSPLAAVVEAAHARGCTVNDIVLSAVAGGLGETLRARGEPLDEIVASVPISSRRSTTVEHLGNETGVLPLTLPLGVDPRDRLQRIALLTKARRSHARGASAGPLGLAFRSLAAMGAFRTMIEHQRLVHTFVTNVRGPSEPLSFAGHRVRSVVPIAVTPGNVGVSFDILSYAGELVLTVVADPEVVPEQDALTAAIRRELTNSVDH